MTQPQQACAARPLTGDLSCIRPAGHDGMHRNFQGIAYRADYEYAEAGPVTVACLAHRRSEPELGPLGCQRDRGHDGHHRDRDGGTWSPTESRGRRILHPDVEARLEAEEAIAGPRVIDVRRTPDDDALDGNGNTWQSRARRLLERVQELEAADQAAAASDAVLAEVRVLLATALLRINDHGGEDTDEGPTESDADPYGEPRLGCATTAELIAELAARADVSATIGEAWPGYRTVDQ